MLEKVSQVIREADETEFCGTAFAVRARRAAPPLDDAP